MEADAAVVMFEESCQAYADGEHPSSIVEIERTPRTYGEVVGGRYAVNGGGNAHLLVTPRLKNFELTFTVEPHRQALRAPQLHVLLRTNPTGHKGYRFVYWFGSYNRLDLQVWDKTASPPVPKTLLSSKFVSAVRLPLRSPLRIRIAVQDNRLGFYRNDKKLLEFVHAKNPITQAGNIALDAMFESAFGVVCPMYFDDIKVTTTDTTKPGKKVFAHRYEIPGELRAAHCRPKHGIEIVELRGSGLEQIRTDAPGGRVYRVSLDVSFPVILGKGRDQAAKTPYIRLERPDGTPIFEQAIYRGVLGSTVPGRKSGSAQLIRLLTEHRTPPHSGIEVRKSPAADVTGPQRTTIYLRQLPDDFHVVAGWKYFMDVDHIAASGPVEAVFRKNGDLIHAGNPLGPGQASLEIGSSLSPGMAARVSVPNQYRKGFLQRLARDHYFLEGEPVSFEVKLALGRGALAPKRTTWNLYDAYLRPLGKAHTVPFVAATDREAATLRSIGRRLFSSGSIRLNLKRPGVYWFRCRADQATTMAAFSIVPKDQKPGNTAARASGIPEISGQFYPMQPWPKDAGHYVTSTGNGRNKDWIEMTRAFNMKIGGQTSDAEMLKRLDAGWAIGELKGWNITPPVFPPGGRLWLPHTVIDKSLKDFLASPFYKPHATDRVLHNQMASRTTKWEVVVDHHFKQWVDHWCRARTQRDSLMRKVLDEVKPGLENSSYGPPLINTFYYGNLYAAKYYGWDWRQKKSTRRLINTWRMETYAHDFGRPPASYTPSIALTKLSIPELNCRWEIYGANGYVIDGRTAQGRAPHGLGLPSRHFITHQVTELSLAPWYFDGRKFAPAGNTHMAPALGGFTQDMMLGMADALRVVAEARAVRPVRGPALVRSYAAAELDPSWKEGSTCNAAAETPAYVYLQSRRAGLAGGVFLDVDDIDRLDHRFCDLLVLPPTRGATAEQKTAIRRKHGQGVALLCFDDCTGLEDLFGVRRLRKGVPIESVQRSAGDTLLNDVPRDARSQRVAHREQVFYKCDGATEVLSGLDAAGDRVAPLLLIHRQRGKPATAFFTLGATDVGRQTEPLTQLSIEGGVASRLMRQR